MVLRFVLISVAFCALLPGTGLVHTAGAQPSEERKALCKDGLRTLKRLDPENQFWDEYSIDDEPTPCFVLADVLKGIFRSSISVPEKPSVDEKIDDIEPWRLQLPQSQVGNDGGAASQGGAVTPAIPLELAGGNVSTVGTEEGAKALASLTFNPFTLFTDTEGNLDDVIGRGETGDVTVLLPASTVNEGNALSYLGLRARINTSALQPGSQRLQKVNERYKDVLQAGADLTGEIEDLVTTTSDVPACVSALHKFAQQSVPSSRVEQDCGGTIARLDPNLEKRLNEAVSEALDEAQKQFFGLDLRTDFGDPTLAGADSTDAIRLFGGATYGQRFRRGGDAALQFRARLGSRYVDLRNLDETSVAVEGGVDLVYQKTYQKQRLEASAGFQGSYTDGEHSSLDTALETDYAAFLASLNVPFTSAYSITVNVRAPVSSDVESTFNVKLNWNLLFPEGQ